MFCNIIFENIAHNNEIIQDGNYIITKKNSNFYITITSEMTPKSLIYASGSTELTLNETFDTLSFGVSIGSANLLSVYKRIKIAATPHEALQQLGCTIT